MNRYSAKSLRNLGTCHPQLRELFTRTLQVVDHSILCGHRNEQDQTLAYVQGKSKARWPDSPHNLTPSRAVDAVIWPIDWDDRERHMLFAGVVLGIAAEMGIDIRWGGDWDRDWEIRDNVFDDLVHFELV